MVDLRKDLFFEFDVFNLVQVDDLLLLQGFQSDDFVAQRCQVHFAKSAGANHTEQVVVGDFAVGVFHLATGQLGA
jgi:hypothetical protein